MHEQSSYQKSTKAICEGNEDSCNRYAQKISLRYVMLITEANYLRAITFLRFLSK